MNKIDRYNAHARHCMDMAARAQHADDKQAWLLLAEVWLDLIPECQRTPADRFDALARNQGVDLRAVDLRLVQ